MAASWRRAVGAAVRRRMAPSLLVGLALWAAVVAGIRDVPLYKGEGPYNGIPKINPQDVPLEEPRPGQTDHVTRGLSQVENGLLSYGPPWPFKENGYGTGFPGPLADFPIKPPVMGPMVNFLRANRLPMRPGEPEQFIVPADFIAKAQAEQDEAQRVEREKERIKEAVAHPPTLVEEKAAVTATATATEDESAKPRFSEARAQGFFGDLFGGGSKSSSSSSSGGGGFSLSGVLGSVVDKVKNSAVGKFVSNTVLPFFGIGAAAAAVTSSLPFKESDLKPRSAPPPARWMDPDFDKLDMPDNCPQRCNKHGKCLIDRSRLVKEGNVEAYPYKCVCEPMYTGVACQTKVDQFVRWFESSGTTPFPRCCPVCPSQFANPTDYDRLPAYQNPFSVGNCDPQLSIDSRPGPTGKPPCWRPLSALNSFTKQVEEGSEAAAAAASLLETEAGAETEGIPPPNILAAARELEKKRLDARLKMPVEECCIYCDFDFWTEANSRPRNPLHDPGSRDAVRALERQRIMEMFGGRAVMQELKRRERLNELEQDRAAGMGDGEGAGREPRLPSGPFGFFLEAYAHAGLTLTPEEQAASDKARAQARTEREAERRRKLSGVESFSDPQAPNPSRGECCSVCPVAANDPEGVDMDQYYKNKGLSETNNRFGQFLRRSRRHVMECCNQCPSQFWIRTVARDTNPFFGPEKVLEPVVIPGADGQPGGGQSGSGTATA